MELWIRTQDKMKLVHNCNLYISNEIRNEYVIEDLNNKYLKLGTYKTKERALEILDEIQKELMPISEYKQEVDNLTISYKNIDTVIYEMPKE